MEEEINDSSVFKGGKYSGKRYGVVKFSDPQYAKWALENAPGLLTAKKKPEPKAAPPRIEPPESSEVPKSAIVPNHNFFNEGPNGNTGNKSV